MNPTDPKVETILARAVDIAAPAERQAYVEQACGGNAALREQVERLIAWNAERVRQLGRVEETAEDGDEEESSSP